MEPLLVFNMKYLEAVQQGMDLLASHPQTIFVGQAMEYKGHAVSHQVKNYPKNKLKEFPVAEEFQAGYCIGLALEGYIPVCIYPRCNFAILAANQIVNHLDKWRLMTGQDIKVIIKMVVGSNFPLDPGHQHKANYVNAFRAMCDNIPVADLTRQNPQINLPSKIILIENTYKKALNNIGPYIIVEDAQLYQDG